MSALTFLLLSLICGGISLSVVAITNHKTRKQRFLRHKLQQLKFHVEELEDRVLALDLLCDDRNIPRLLNEDVIERYEAMMELQPDTPHIAAAMANAKQRQEQLSDLTGSRPISRICDSDAHIARQQACVNEAARVLRRQHTKGKLSSSELQGYLNELIWLHLQIEVVSLIACGHKAFNRRDIITANGYYKRAQTVLMQSHCSDPRKHRMIKEMGEIMTRKRTAISEDLMPETSFNPPTSMMEDKSLEENLEEIADAIASAQQGKKSTA